MCVCVCVCAGRGWAYVQYTYLPHTEDMYVCLVMCLFLQVTLWCMQLTASRRRTLTGDSHLLASLFPSMLSLGGVFSCFIF